MHCSPRLLFARSSLLLFLSLVCAVFTAAAAPSKPNIVLILADDLGYGDVHCFNPEGKIATPNIDRLASQGMRFTDAHSSSSVCTPTRYGLLTGRYNWRSRLKNGVLGGMSPRLIEQGRLTLPAMLKEQGYTTACVGKWHLGMDWTLKPDAQRFNDSIEKGENGWRVDFSKPIQNGPTAVGFDHYFGIAASLDMVPYTFIENDHVLVQPTVDKAFPMMLGREGRTTRRGPAAADFDASHVQGTLIEHAQKLLGEYAAGAREGKSFFLYIPMAAPHTPIVPTSTWQEKSQLNRYADFVMQVDASVGELLTTLERSGVADNTIVIFTSDNGCSPEAKFDELQKNGHFPSAQFRGTKADLFEGGHRVPFIVSWPGKVKAGATSNQLICLNDVMATCAEILGAKLPENAAEDSVSFLPALAGSDGDKPLREALVHHSINGSFAIRQGDWKLLLSPDSGGWSAPRPGSPKAKELPPVQLYNLANDIAESRNVQVEQPEIVERLTKLLERYVADGRSTPGAPQQNTGEVHIWKKAVRAESD